MSLLLSFFNNLEDQMHLSLQCFIKTDQNRKNILVALMTRINVKMWETFSV